MSNVKLQGLLIVIEQLRGWCYKIKILNKVVVSQCHYKTTYYQWHIVLIGSPQFSITFSITLDPYKNFTAYRKNENGKKNPFADI
jgi:hypothetical protein